MSTFTALLLHNEPAFKAEVSSVEESFLTEQDVLVAVDYSTINYKDALAITNSGKIVSSFPFIPGIDFAGRVVKSNTAEFKEGDRVVSTGFGVGERYCGGLSEYVWAKAQWLTSLPSAISAEQAMSVGTGGFTAMLCVDALIASGITPENGKIAVSGASGGVGSFAVAILANMGYQVTAISSKQHAYLTALGASECVATDDFSGDPRPLAKQQWAAAIDVVGNKVLANLLSQMNYGGVVACCGLAGGFALNTTVMPFILRGVSLVGVDSVEYPSEKRAAIWARFADLMPKLGAIHHDIITLTEVPDFAQKMVDNKIQGRSLVRITR